MCPAISFLVCFTCLMMMIIRGMDKLCGFCFSVVSYRLFCVLNSMRSHFAYFWPLSNHKSNHNAKDQISILVLLLLHSLRVPGCIFIGKVIGFTLSDFFVPIFILFATNSLFIIFMVPSKFTTRIDCKYVVYKHQFNSKSLLFCYTSI